ncbi:MAG: BMP family ABC transporter substrate-binding protein [Erysipelotrichaceae bacterium]|nr:BMP family ABC transporter substrate-binding protein [Erysipelotrichaceae bacterium]
MKKLLTVLLAVLMIVGLTACGGGSSSSDDSTAPAADDGVIQADIVLITDAKSVDDKGFNQYSWVGVLAYAEPNGISHNYYMPTEQTTEQYVAQIDTAVKGGAKIIVCPGYLFGDAVSEAQFTYPDVTFICVDFTPADVQSNAIGVLFEEEESGYLAGYAAVKEGFTKLGFAGAMAVPAVKNFGYGFVAGAEKAAEEMGLEPGSIEIKYNYTGEFAEKPEYVNTYNAWYTAGTEIIFGCGSPRNVFQAADTVNATADTKVWAIGVDTDCSDQSEWVMTSAMKNLAPVICELISEVYDGTFEGGRENYYNINDDAVALPMASSKFTNFTTADYDAMVASLTGDNAFREALPTASDYNTIKDYADAGVLTYVNIEVLTDN